VGIPPTENRRLSTAHYRAREAADFRELACDACRGVSEEASADLPRVLAHEFGKVGGQQGFALDEVVWLNLYDVSKQGMCYGPEALSSNAAASLVRDFQLGSTSAYSADEVVERKVRDLALGQESSGDDCLARPSCAADQIKQCSPYLLRHLDVRGAA
jgi:hypothetical protein